MKFLLLLLTSTAWGINPDCSGTPDVGSCSRHNSQWTNATGNGCVIYSSGTISCSGPIGGNIASTVTNISTTTHLDGLTMNTDASTSKKPTILAGSTVTWTAGGEVVYIVLNGAVDTTNGAGQEICVFLNFNGTTAFTSLDNIAYGNSNPTKCAYVQGTVEPEDISFRIPVTTANGSNTASLFFASMASTNYALEFNGANNGMRTIFRVEKR